MRKHVVEMDVARALATLAVVAIHISATPLVYHVSAFSTLFYLFLNIGARFAVPTFVVLSGAGLSLSNRDKEGYISFLKSRLSKLVPIYLVWSVVYTLVFNRHVEFVHFCKLLITGFCNYHLYFVPLIVILYALFPLLHRPMKTVPGLVISAVVTFVALYANSHGWYPKMLVHMSVVINPVCAVLHISAAKVNGAIMDFLCYAGNPLNWLFYLAFGVWLAKPEVLAAFTSPKYRALATAGFVLALAGMIGVAYRAMVRGADINFVLMWITLLMMPYTVIFFLWVYKQEWGGIGLSASKWFSRHSFGIYLAHPMLLAVFFHFLFRTPAKQTCPIAGILALATGFVGTAVMCELGARAKRYAAAVSSPKQS